KEKKEYKDEGSYAQIFENPKDFSRKKLVLNAVFQNIVLKPPKPYDELLPSYNIVNIENAKSIPFMFSSKNEDLRKVISEIQPGKLIKFFGVLYHKTYSLRKPGKVNIDNEKFYFFEIDDIELISSEKDGGNSLNFMDADDFTDVEFRRIDIQYAKFLDRKVKFNISFKDIDNKLPTQFIKLSNISEDTHFQLLAVEPFHTPIIIQRDNEKAVNALVNTMVNANLTIYGTLKSIRDPSLKNESPQFYIDVNDIKNEPLEMPVDVKK
ncbi:MAG: hypothetical protein WCP55_19650, partial [Lentisphaerota bacterium]